MKNYYLFKFAIAGLSIFMLASWTTTYQPADHDDTKDVRQVGNFVYMSLETSCDIVLTQGSGCSVELEGDKDDIEKIITEVSDNKLIIKQKNHCFNISHKVTVYITMQQIKGLSVAGSGDITSDSRINSNELNLSVSGSGSINLADLLVKKMSTSVTGSGNIKTAGKSNADELNIVITGSGNYNGENLGFEKINATITGSGSAKVYALEELKTNVIGSGSVHYKGDPNINANSVGSGKTKKID